MLENIKKLVRRLKYGEPLIHFTVRLRSDQMEYLSEKVENIGEWIRNAVDSAILEETQTVDKSASKLAIVKIIEIRKRELQKYINDPFYKNAQQILGSMARFFQESKKQRDIKIMADGGILLWGGLYSAWMDTDIPTSFIIENKLRFNEAIPEDMIPLLSKELKQHHKYTQAKFDVYKQKVEEIKNIIKELQERLCAT